MSKKRKLKMNMYKALDELTRAEKHIKEMENAITKFKDNSITQNKLELFEFTENKKWKERY